MATTLATGTELILADSQQHLRPGSQANFRANNNADPCNLDYSRDQERKNQIKLPSIIGRTDVDSFREVSDPKNFGYRRYNDVGEYRPPAPHRSFEHFVSPVSGLMSAGGDVDRNTGHTHIPVMVVNNENPLAGTPQAKNSIRMDYAFAPPELVRQSEDDPGAPYMWNERKVIDESLRAKFGGWTSDKDPRTERQKKEVEATDELEDMMIKKTHSLRDKLASRYQFTTSTQRSFEHVPWDKILAPKLWPPTSTLEERPDMLHQRYTLKRYRPHAEEWQSSTASWDLLQLRRGYYKDGPIPGIVFCSSWPRAKQIPGYGGAIGATNLEEIDNRNEPFKPLTIKRSQVPRYTDTAHRPTIPGYTGCTPQGDAGPPYGYTMPPEHILTSAGYRRIPLLPNTPAFIRESPMSKMITTVCPYNPFNKMVRKQVTC